MNRRQLYRTALANLAQLIDMWRSRNAKIGPGGEPFQPTTIDCSLRQRRDNSLRFGPLKCATARTKGVPDTTNNESWQLNRSASPNLPQPTVSEPNWNVPQQECQNRPWKGIFQADYHRLFNPTTTPDYSMRFEPLKCATPGTGS